MQSSNPAQSGPDPDILIALLDASPLAAVLDETSRAALLAVLAGPISTAWLEPPADRAFRDQLAQLLVDLRVPPAVAATWLNGLVAAGHSCDVLADLEARGLVVTWESPPGISVTLTPWCADRVGVELQEWASDDEPFSRWAPIDPRPRPVRIRQRFGCDQSMLDSVAAPPTPDHSEVEDQAPRWERAEPVVDEVSSMPVKLWGHVLRRDHRRNNPLGPKVKPKGRSKNGPKPDPKSNPDRPAKARARRPKRKAKAKRPKTSDRPGHNSFDLTDLAKTLG